MQRGTHRLKHTRGRLRALGGRDSEEVEREAERAVEAGAAKAPGAFPSTELERTGAFVVPFGVRWHSHEEARRWALEVLTGRVTCAADGSQILPGREISLARRGSAGRVVREPALARRTG
jgi:hypothetical protein